MIPRETSVAVNERECVFRESMKSDLLCQKGGPGRRTDARRKDQAGAETGQLTR